MKVVVDTSILIDHLPGVEAAWALLEDRVRGGHELCSLSVVRTEILAGLRSNEEDATLALLDSLTWLDVTVEIADRAGAIARRYLRSHPGTDTVDFVIAACVEALGAELLTLNVKHFTMFVGLTRPYER